MDHHKELAEISLRFHMFAISLSPAASVRVEMPVPRKSDSCAVITRRTAYFRPLMADDIARIARMALDQLHERLVAATGLEVRAGQTQLRHPPTPPPRRHERPNYTGAGEDTGIDHNKIWLRFPYDSTFLAIPLSPPAPVEP
jgi:hypothetical protein